jgi:hypothetical protein
MAISLYGGGTNTLAYQTSQGNTAFVTAGTQYQSLTTTSGGVPIWSSQSNTQFLSIGVGTTPDTANTGSIRATGQVTAYYSDERLKTNLGVIENAIDKVKSLDGFYHEANELAQELGYEKIREIGISAQQAIKVIPEVVAKAPINEDYLTVRYERLVPLLIEAIKEQQKQIDELKDKINGNSLSK